MSKTKVTVPPDQSIVLTERDFQASAKQLFKAHTEPDAIEQWWGVFDGMRTKVDVIEPRFGGRWRFINTATDGTEHIFRGVYHIVEPDHIVYTFEYEPMPGHVCIESVRFIENGNITTISTVTSFTSVEDRDGMVDSGMEYGTDGGYNSLDTYLASL